MTPSNNQSPMVYMRKVNVERMMMKESDFVTLEMYMDHLQKKMKAFKKKSKQIAKLADALTKGLEKSKAMKLKNDAKELFDDISDVLGDDTPSPSPRFSPGSSPHSADMTQSDPFPSRHETKSPELSRPRSPTTPSCP